MRDLILIGGGGHCKSVIDVVEAEGKYRIKGILDKEQSIGNTVLGYSIIGSDGDIKSLINSETDFLITVGQIKTASVRKKLFDILSSAGASLATIISPNVYVSKHARIGRGTIIMHHACVNSGAHIGENCIINTKALLEHDTQIGDHCHISTAAVINGEVKIGPYSFIGSNAVLVNNIEIATACVIGAGSIVNRSILFESKTVAGNPARVINE